MPVSTVCGRLIMYDDYEEEDYEDFVDNPPRLIACPPDNVTAAAPSVMGDRCSSSSSSSGGGGTL